MTEITRKQVIDMFNQVSWAVIGVELSFTDRTETIYLSPIREDPSDNTSRIIGYKAENRHYEIYEEKLYQMVQRLNELTEAPVQEENPFRRIPDLTKGEVIEALNFNNWNPMMVMMPCGEYAVLTPVRDDSRRYRKGCVTGWKAESQTHSLYAAKLTDIIKQMNQAGVSAHAK